MMKYCLFVLLAAVIILSVIPGCLPEISSAAMELYVENTTDRPLVVAVNGVNYGEIPPHAMSVFLMFDKTSEKYRLKAYDPAKEYLFEKTFQNNELKK